jgi:hypothetical protein
LALRSYRRFEQMKRISNPQPKPRRCARELAKRRSIAFKRRRLQKSLDSLAKKSPTTNEGRASN